MTPRQREALTAICLLAALADGDIDQAERARMEALAKELDAASDDHAPASARAFENVTLKRTTVETEAAALDAAGLRMQAYEMAVGICQADGGTSQAERDFLAKLATLLGQNATEAARVVAMGDQLANDPLAARPGVIPPALPVAVGAGTAAAASATGAPGSGQAPADAAEASVRNYAILCAALEFLPQSLASAAIIPLQMKMVYEVGLRYGFTLDKGHIRDLLVTCGLGATSQVLEGYARRMVRSFVPGLAKRVLGSTLGGLAGSAANLATGPAITFATTYALGQVARQYYAGGRTLSAVSLQDLFGKELALAQSKYDQLAPAIRTQASSLNPAKLLSLVRGV